MSGDGLRERAARYYEAKLGEHGATAQGVDWRDESSQELRFAQLLRVAPRGERFTLLDYGCGYGALVDWLARAGYDADYTGYDPSAAMVAAARERHPGTRFTDAEADLAAADYVVASGVFNVKLDVPYDEWQAYVLATLDRLDALARRGFAFNVLTSYSDRELMRDDLYYADPGLFFDHCKRRYSRFVALLHDYGLYEFTIVVRR